MYTVCEYLLMTGILQTGRGACSDPESFVRGGPTLTTLFLVDDGRTEDPYKIKAGHHRLTIETPFKWCFAGVPMMAKH